MCSRVVVLCRHSVPEDRQTGVFIAVFLFVCFFCFFVFFAAAAGVYKKAHHISRNRSGGDKRQWSLSVNKGIGSALRIMDAGKNGDPGCGNEERGL